MLKIFLLLFFLLSFNRQIFAQYRLEGSIGIQSNDVYDERLSSKVYSGQSKDWKLGFTTKGNKQIQMDFSSKELYPDSRGVLANQDVFHFKEAGLRFLNNRNFLDSLKLPIKFYWGFVVNLYGRYSAQVLSSTILPYDQTLISFQIALAFGLHFKTSYQIKESQRVELDVTGLFINSGANNPYSPHDNWYLYETLMFPKFVDIYVPLTYSYRFHKKIIGKLSFVNEYYKFSDIQANLIFKTSFLGSVEYVF